MREDFIHSFIFTLGECLWTFGGMFKAGGQIFAEKD